MGLISSFGFSLQEILFTLALMVCSFLSRRVSEVFFAFPQLVYARRDVRVTIVASVV